MLSCVMATYAQQVIGREAETATLFSRCLVSLSLRVAVSARVNAAVVPLLCKFEICIYKYDS